LYPVNHGSDNDERSFPGRGVRRSAFDFDVRAGTGAPPLQTCTISNFKLPAAKTAKKASFAAYRRFFATLFQDNSL